MFTDLYVDLHSEFIFAVVLVDGPEQIPLLASFVDEDSWQAYNNSKSVTHSKTNAKTDQSIVKYYKQLQACVSSTFYGLNTTQNGV